MFGEKRMPFRGRRLVVGGAGVYHVVSRTAFKHFAFDAAEKERFIRILHRQAGFCGVEVLAFCVMSNHFHLLVKVPEKQPIDDAELLRRYRLLYGGRICPASSPSPLVLEALLRENAPEGQAVRERLLDRMHDLGVFMRELKQRFGIWYNHRHENCGTLWSERFRSTIVEASVEALSVVAAYLDLNPVRAQLVDDPLDYRFCSYARAVQGDRAARRGYERVFCSRNAWKDLLPGYNLILYGMGEHSKGAVGKDAGRIDSGKAVRVLDSGGRWPLWLVLRKRVRYFSEGAALGSRAFLEGLGQRWNEQCGRHRTRHAHKMAVGDWGELRAYRNLKKRPVADSG